MPDTKARRGTKKTRTRSRAKKADANARAPATRRTRVSQQERRGSAARPATVMKLEDLPPVVTVEEASAYLRLDRKVLYAEIQDAEDRGQKLQGVRRFGRAIRIDRRVLANWFGAEHLRQPEE